jgi:tetratricopeptide (TPR) repeat protein
MKIITRIFIYVLLTFSLLSWSQNQKIDSLVLVLKSTKNDIDKAQLLNVIADQYKTSDPKVMEVYATKALQLSQKINYKIEEGNAYLNLGNVNIIIGNYPLALQHFSTAQKIFETETSTNSKNDLTIKKWEWFSRNKVIIPKLYNSI